MKFKESDIEFEFGRDCLVKKFDEHRYYNILSGSGLKGVDFIVIYKNEFLYLIEVKNYKKRSFSPVAPDVSDLLGDPCPLVDQFVEKIQDSITLINVVKKYLAKKWWFGLTEWIKKMLPEDYSLNRDMDFWLKAKAIIENDKSKLQTMLIIDFDEKYESLSSAEIAQLKFSLSKNISLGLEGLTFSLAFPERGKFSL